MIGGYRPRERDVAEKSRELCKMYGRIDVLAVQDDHRI